jgi:CCR4-NOT transcription complex subunit 1
VSNTTLGLALRYVLDSLRKQPNTPSNAKIYRFGLYALEQFRSRLPRWPQYCAHVVAIRHLRDSQPAFVAEIQAALAAGQAGEPAVMQGTSSLLVGPEMGVGMALSADGSVVSASGDASTTSLAHEPSAAPATASSTGGGAGGPVAASADPSSASADAAAAAAARLALLNPQQRQHVELRSRISGLGADLTAALVALAAGLPVPTVLPSAAAAAAVARDAEESSSSSGVAAPSAAATGGSGDAERVVDSPPAAVADRVNFIVNNLTDATLDAKAAEMVSFLKIVSASLRKRCILEDYLTSLCFRTVTFHRHSHCLMQEHYPWLGSYLTKRVAAQPNYQLLYRSFIERLKQRTLDAEVLRATLDSIRRLFASDRIRVDPRERRSGS